MSITDYSSLQSSVASRIHRDTSETLPSGQTVAQLIQECIALAESNMSAQIKSRSMETRSNLSTVASNAYVALPTDLVESRRLIITSTDPQRVLKYVSPDELTYKYPSSSNIDEPVVWTVIGSNLQLGPTPDAVYTLELTYLQKIPALSGSNTTNWLLTAFPDVYLYGTLIQVAQYTNDARLQAFTSLYREAVTALNSMDWYSGSSMAVRRA
jgi:hypothetical protein